MKAPFFNVKSRVAQIRIETVGFSDSQYGYPKVPDTLLPISFFPMPDGARLLCWKKDLEHQLAPIDLSNNPANFRAISPYGKVPVLIGEDATI